MAENDRTPYGFPQIDTVFELQILFAKCHLEMR